MQGWVPARCHVLIFAAILAWSVGYLGIYTYLSAADLYITMSVIITALIESIEIPCAIPTCCRSRFQTDQIAQLSLVVLTLNCIWLVCYTPWRPICCSTCQLHPPFYMFDPSCHLRHSLQCVHCEFLPFLNSLIQHLLLLLFVSQLSIMIPTQNVR